MYLLFFLTAGLLLLDGHSFAQPEAFLLGRFKEQFVDTQQKIQETNVVYFNKKYQHWAKMKIDLDYITYEVEQLESDDSPPLGIATFTCKSRQSDFLKSQEEAQEASMEGIVPTSALCRATYEFRNGKWVFKTGEIYSRNPEWDVVAAEKLEGFPQAMFYLMKETAPIALDTEETNEHGDETKQQEEEAGQ